MGKARFGTACFFMLQEHRHRLICPPPQQICALHACILTQTFLCRHGCEAQGLEWGALRCFSSTGEASAPEDYHWLVALGGYKPVLEYCGGTEIGGGFLSGTLLQPQVPAPANAQLLKSALQHTCSVLQLPLNSNCSSVGHSTAVVACWGKCSIDQFPGVPV